MIYLDYSATTPLCKEAFEKMKPLFFEDFGNADSLHAYGRKSAYLVACARDQIAEVLGVSPQEVYFTSGGTEADHWAVKGIKSQRGERVLYSAIEHSALLGAVKGKNATAVMPTAEGVVTAQAVKEKLTDETGLVCVQAVNNETGVVMPIAEIAKACHEAGAYLFSDCVQAGCTQDLKALASACDAIALSSHKVYGPKGVGALVVKNGVPLSPLFLGGEQERGLRGGTVNTAGVVGFATALVQAQREREAFVKRITPLREKLEYLITSALGDGVRLDGKGGTRVPNISHFTFFGAGSETLLNRLDLKGIACSGGSACSAHSALPSHVMLAMGRSEEEALRGIRFSLGKRTTDEEIEITAKTVINLMGGRL